MRASVMALTRPTSPCGARSAREWGRRRRFADDRARPPGRAKFATAIAFIPVKIVVLSNPASGKGEATALAGGILRALAGDGHSVEQLGTDNSSELPSRLEGADALVLVGGDGTLHHTLPALIGSRVPVYQAPRGTENLFAREWRMDAQIATLRRALSKGEVVDADVGIATTEDGRQRAFAIMCSVGPDAGIVHSVAAARSGAITKWSYVVPAIGQALRPRFGKLSVTVDGREIVDGRKGLIIVANSRQYAARIDPCVRADASDGLLDVVFFPLGLAAATVLWAAASRLRLHTKVPGLVYATGTSVTVMNRGERSAPAQMDGEAAGSLAGMGTWTLRVRPGALRVLAVADNAITR
jgi:diacylglycerol kinase (ATP)